ncbi:MAG: sulfite exporter TauE/SafE family protein [Deltaproteobacteria bacterium]|nr:sulfite exporter TauE/SafE family protein [Deltaproteobacteria bacterium]
MSAPILVLFVIVGFLLGLLGGGGSILTIPLLLYGVGLEPKRAIATSLVVVSLGSLAAMLSHARAGKVVWRAGLSFAAAGTVGAYAGGRLAASVPDAVLLWLFASMMVATSIGMLKERVAREDTRNPAPSWQISLLGGIVGGFAGLVGAGGGFLVVPALTLLGGLPTKQAVGTSLLVTTLISAAGFVGHADHAALDFTLVSMMAALLALGSLLGSLLSQRVPEQALRKAFGVLVFVLAAFVIFEQLET